MYPLDRRRFWQAGSCPTARSRFWPRPVRNEYGAQFVIADRDSRRRDVLVPAGHTGCALAWALDGAIIIVISTTIGRACGVLGLLKHGLGRGSDGPTLLHCSMGY